MELFHIAAGALVGLIIEPDTMSKNQAVNQVFLFLGKPEYDDFVLIFASGAITRA